jgi:hypothetical protein
METSVKPIETPLTQAFFKGLIVHRAGDGARWKFDYVAYNLSYRESLKTGKDTYAEWFVKRTK